MRLAIFNAVIDIARFIIQVAVAVIKAHGQTALKVIFGAQVEDKITPVKF